VRPTSSVLKYASAGGDVIAAGHELGVDTVLDRSVQRSGDTIRVTVRLVRVSDGVPLWANFLVLDRLDVNVRTVHRSQPERKPAHTMLVVVPGFTPAHEPQNQNFISLERRSRREVAISLASPKTTG